MNQCDYCGNELKPGAKFCTQCGKKVEPKKVSKKKLDKKIRTVVNKTNEELFMNINNNIRLNNSQTKIVKRFSFLAFVCGLILILAMADLDSFHIHPAVTFVSIFLMLVFIAIAYMFRSREKKLQTLITGENLIAHWTLTNDEKYQYSNYLYQKEKAENLSKWILLSILFLVVFGITILIIEEAKLAIFFIMTGFICFFAFIAFIMPVYYRNKNMRADGEILIGQKFAYVNVLADAEIFENLPRYADWPTFPQLYINGELVGGCDITLEMHASGELQKMTAEAAKNWPAEQD